MHMPSVALVVVAFAVLVGCAQLAPRPATELVVAYPPAAPGGNTESALMGEEQPNICFGSCPRIPEFEKLGHLCTLDRRACVNRILTCYYNCVPVEEPEVAP